MRILTHAPELVVPSDRAEAQRLRHKSARRLRPDARASLPLSQRPRPLTPPCKLAPLRLLRSDKVMSTYMDKEMGAKGCPPHVYAMGEVTDAPPLLPSGPAAPAPARMGLQ